MRKNTVSLNKKSVATAMLLALSAMTGSAFAADLSKYDKTFIDKAADAGATEIAASKVAQTKGGSPAVKGFADTMVTDHTKVAGELKELATSKGVTPSDAPSKPHQAEIDKLGTLDGAKFDAEYTNKIGVAAHTDAVKLFTDASKKANDPDVKAFAAKTLPGLEHHLEMAKELHAGMAKK